MSGINWDIAHEQAKRDSIKYASDHPNHTIEAAYFAGYIKNAAERESLRIIVDRLEKERAVNGTAVIAPIAPSLGDFL